MARGGPLAGGRAHPRGPAGCPRVPAREPAVVDGRTRLRPSGRPPSWEHVPTPLDAESWRGTVLGSQNGCTVTHFTDTVGQHNFLCHRRSPMTHGSLVTEAVSKIALAPPGAVCIRSLSLESRL